MEKHVKKEYTNGEITVIWQSEKCIHSGNCVKNLKAVFNPSQKPWIQMDKAGSDAIVDAVSKCPSGALSIK
ncbi:MAG: (4Fe-4S)-binding protein [Cyclobacteriaceae bacterium]|nr:(4Fe-4S)-binding protein [Cyclobacteriaceae bacterium]